jgi:hypothetical protein
MSETVPLSVPQDYAGWAVIMQCISGVERVDVKGRRTSEEIHVARVPIPDNLVGFEDAEKGIVHIQGDADRGYVLQVRESFPRPEQVNYVVQRAPHRSAQWPENFWIGVHVDKPSRLRQFTTSMWQRGTPIPDQVQLEAPRTTSFMRLTPSEYVGFAGLLTATLKRRDRKGVNRQLQPIWMELVSK